MARRVYVSASFNSRSSGGILIKFGMDICHSLSVSVNPAFDPVVVIYPGCVTGSAQGKVSDRAAILVRRKVKIKMISTELFITYLITQTNRIPRKLFDSRKGRREESLSAK
jgi:hypothetical protein